MIKIQKKGINEEYDVTSYIDKDTEIVVNKEHSRTAFEVVYSDVRLTFSNMDSFFYELFADNPAEWVVTIINEAINHFGGEIEKSTISFDCVAEKVSFDVFSTNKIFWERAKTTKINHNFTADEKTYEYSTLLHLLHFNLHPDYTENFRDLFNTITILDKSNYPAKYDYDYAGRTIRWYHYGYLFDIVSMSVEDSRIHLGVTVPYSEGDVVVIWGVEGAVCNWEGRPVDINGCHVVASVSGESFTLLRVHIDTAGTGGQVMEFPRNTAGFPAELPFNDSITGRYADLDDGMTVAELLEALEVSYNAEFVVDFFNHSLIMKRRQSPNEEAAKSIDGIVCDDGGVELIIEDQDKYDYLYTVTKAEEAPAPILKSLTDGDAYGNYATEPPDVEFYVSNFIGDKEIALSKPLVVHRVWLTVQGRWYTRQYVVLTIPPGIPGTTKRAIYSTVLGKPDLGVRKRIDISGNDAYEWTDLGGYGAVLPTWLNEPIAGWIRYDETTLAWEDPIIDAFNGANRPEQGKIFEVYPKLRFVNTVTRSPVSSQTLFDVFCFFGKDTTLTNIKENWKPLFLTTAVMKCRVLGMDFKDSDEITRPQYPFLNTLNSNNFRVLKANVNLTTEETELELVQL